ncbi:MAG TPA: CPBP family intramembrane glutamic endopeptidase [Coleofasciculaceae cyanobacterium]
MKHNLANLVRYPAPVRLGTFLAILLLLWLPVAAPIYYLLSYDPNLVTILTMGLLFGEFLLLLRFWGRRVYQQPQLLKSYGLEGRRQNGLDLLKGLTIGLLFTLGLFALEGLLGWVQFQIPPVILPRIILEGLVSALGIGFAEQLVFRGWLLDELQRDYSQGASLWADAIIYAVLHFLKPLSEIVRTLSGFPGLLLLGLTLVWAKRSSGGLLGLPIGIHAGLVWGYYILKVGKLVKYSDQVSPWITGVDGNPIAGIMGLIFMGILALWMRKQAQTFSS